MAPLVRQGFYALFAIGMLNVAAIMAGDTEDSDRRADTSNNARAGLRGSLESLRKRANDAVDSLQPSTIELAAVALSNINTFWLSLTPAARDQLLEQMSQSIKEEQASAASNSHEDASTHNAANSGKSPSSRSRQLREVSEDVALVRVLRKLEDATTSSTAKPLDSIAADASADSSAAAANDSDSENADDSAEREAKEDADEPAEPEVIEEILVEEGGDEGLIVSAETRKEDATLDRIQRHFEALRLNEDDVILAFRAFIRRHHDFFDADREFITEYVNSKEFKEQVGRLREAIRKYEAEKEAEENSQRADVTSTTTVAPSESAVSTAAPATGAHR